jgi:hypothetical protein
VSNLILPNEANFESGELAELKQRIFLGLDVNEQLGAVNDLATMPYDYGDPMLNMLAFMKRPENFWYTTKFLMDKELHPFQLSILLELWTRKFPMLIAARGAGKTWILALYALLRAVFEQGCRIVVVGAAFRQSKLIFEYMETIYKESPILRNMIGGAKHQGPKRDIDRCTFYVGRSEIVAIPIGDGQKIRGMRANYVLADEFASIPQEVFEVVIRGFGSVSLSPVNRVWDKAEIKALKMLGMYVEAEEAEEQLGFGNQTVISGTAYYSFNHLYDYWKRYKEIIESKGDERRLREIFHGEVPEDFDHEQFSIIRLPHHELPEGFMDETQIAQAKAMSHSSIYLMEYGAIFAKDSDGFFKRAMIERAVCNATLQTATGEMIEPFEAATYGNPNLRYVWGIDPASESDNFAIVILEQWKKHRRIVYSWTINRESLRERVKQKGQQNDKSFYNYCAKKIRQLIKIFPTDHIGMDAMGGGIAIMEALHDKDQKEEEEYFIWPYRKQGDKDVFWWEEKDKPTDGEAGRHILHMVQFAKADFTANANHALRKDLESKVVLFPRFDSVTLGEAYTQDKLLNREFDTLEDCVMEIEDLKDELATIEHTQTPSGRDKWDTPEVKLPGGKKGRLRKDRCSALLIANYLCHVMEHELEGQPHQWKGGFAGQPKSKKAKTGQLYTGPDHIVKQMNGLYGRGVSR